MLVKIREAGTTEQFNNAIFKKPFKIKQQEQDIDQATKDINDELNNINKDLTKKNDILKNLNTKINNQENTTYIDKMSRGPAIRKAPPLSKSLAPQQKFQSDEDSTIPSKLLKNQWKDKEDLNVSPRSNNTTNFNAINFLSKKNELVNPVISWNNTQSFKPSNMKENQVNDWSKTIDFSRKEVTDSKIFSKPNFKKAKEQPTPQKNEEIIQELPVKSNNKNKSNLPAEKEEEEEGELLLCPEGCGRKFRPKALIKHASICKKVFGSKRNEFDSMQARTTEYNTQFVVNKNSKAPTKGKATNDTKKETKREKEEKENKWKKDSEALRAGIQAARNKK